MPIPQLTRRLFLRRSLQTAAGVTALPWLAAAPGCAPAEAPPGRTALRVLGPSEALRLAAVADSFVPAGGAFPAGALSIDIVARVDTLLISEPRELAAGLASALLVVELASPLLAGRLARFSELDLAERSACLQALCDSRFGLARELYAGLKQLCLFSFYSADASWSALGYDGPWVERPSGRAGAA